MPDITLMRKAGFAMWMHAAAARPPGPPPTIATSQLSMKQNHFNWTMQRQLIHKREQHKKERARLRLVEVVELYGVHKSYMCLPASTL